MFIAFKVNYAILGITAYQSLQPYPFNIKILLAFLMFSLSTTSHLTYIFNVANTFTEYTECITTTSGSFIISVCFATMVFKMTTLFEFISQLEEIVKMSEFNNQTYCIMQIKVEKTNNRIIHFKEHKNLDRQKLCF